MAIDIAFSSHNISSLWFCVFDTRALTHQAHGRLSGISLSLCGPRFCYVFRTIGPSQPLSAVFHSDWPFSYVNWCIKRETKKRKGTFLSDMFSIISRIIDERQTLLCRNKFVYSQPWVFQFPSLRKNIDYCHLSVRTVISSQVGGRYELAGLWPVFISGKNAALEHTTKALWGNATVSLCLC